MKNKIKYSLILLFSSTLSAQEMPGFSSDLLKQLGIDPTIVSKIESGTNISGEILAPVYINGEKIDILEIKYKDSSNFYANKELLDLFYLKNDLEENEEVLFKDVYPESQVKYENAALNIFVPSSYFNDDLTYQQIGRGGFLNYDLEYEKELTSDNGLDESDVFGARLDYGINFDGFLYRGLTTYDNVRDDFDISYNYLQKNFLRRKTLGRVGDVYTLNPYHTIVSTLGIQYASDPYLTSSSIARVEGTVNGETRVEIFINETTKIYDQVVSSGYYEFTDVALPFLANTLRVVERGLNGSYNEREVLVQQTGFTLGDDVEFAITAGMANDQVIDDDDDSTSSIDYDDWIVSGYSDVYKTTENRLTGSFLLADGYYFGGLGFLDSKVLQYNIASYNVDAGLSYSDDEYGEGYYLSGGMNFDLGTNYGFNIFSRYESENYRQLESTPSDFKTQYNMSYYSDFYLFDTISLNYGKTFYYEEDPLAYYNVILQKDYADGSYLSLEGYYDTDDEWNVNLFVSIPIDITNYLSYMDFGYFRDRTSEDLELGVNGDQNGYNYSSRARYSITDNTSNLSMSVEKDFKDTYASSGVYLSDEGFENAYLSLEGGIAFSSKGYVDLVSEDIDETFAFIKIADFDDVEVDTPSGTVYTDEGVAVIPSIRPYAVNDFEIKTSTLPENITIDNGYQEIYLTFGSVGDLFVSTKPFYKSLIQIRDNSGELVPANSFVLDLEDKFVTTVGFDGLVFFESETLNTEFKVKLEKGFCVFNLENMKKSKDDSGIDSVVCK